MPELLMFTLSHKIYHYACLSKPLAKMQEHVRCTCTLYNNTQVVLEISYKQRHSDSF